MGRRLLRMAAGPVMVVWLAAGCASNRLEPGRWRGLERLEVTGKTRSGEKVSVLEFCRPEAVRPVLERLREEWPEGLTARERVSRLLEFVQGLPVASDPDDLWQQPGETLLGGGDCEDRTFLLVSLLAAEGETGWVMVGTYNERPHTWGAWESGSGALYYLETLDRGGRLRGPSGAYEPWGRWDTTGRIEEWTVGE